MLIIDISQLLEKGIPVWPGDEPFRSAWSARIGDGSSVNVGAITASLHTGTHADAPLHVKDQARSIDEIPLDAYVGPAVVIECISTGPIGPEILDNVDIGAAARILLKTRDRAPGAWEETFAHLTSALAERISNEGAMLVGIDTPSVDHPESKDLPAHHALFEGGVANLENLRLNHVAPGRYWLCAAPLYIKDMDASPVRAVLIPLDDLRASL